MLQSLYTQTSSGRYGKSKGSPSTLAHPSNNSTTRPRTATSRLTRPSIGTSCRILHLEIAKHASANCQAELGISCSIPGSISEWRSRARYMSSRHEGFLGELGIFSTRSSQLVALPLCGRGVSSVQRLSFCSSSRASTFFCVRLRKQLWCCYEGCRNRLLLGWPPRALTLLGASNEVSRGAARVCHLEQNTGDSRTKRLVVVVVVVVSERCGKVVMCERGEEGKGREGKGREGKGREGKGREGKGREGKSRVGSRV